MFPVVLPLRHLPVQIELIGTVTRKITVCVCVCLCVSVGVCVSGFTHVHACSVISVGCIHSL